MKNRLLLFLIAIVINSLTVSAQSWLWGVQGTTGLKQDVYTKAVATNRTGNVYHTGGYANTIAFGAYTLISHDEDAFLVKYDTNGTVLWAKTSGGINGNVYGYSVASDDSDDAYVTGLKQYTAIFGTDTLYNNDELFIVKYNANGDVLWARQPALNFVNGTEGWSIATDKRSNVYVTGDGAFLLKYDRNGNLIWSTPQTNHRFNDSPNEGFSVAPDIFGNVYISGQFSDSLKFGTYRLYSATMQAFIAKFDSNGNVLWAQQSTGNSNIDEEFDYGNSPQFSVATDRTGAAYFTGPFADSIQFGSQIFTSAPHNDSIFNFFLMKYKPNGDIEWGKQAIPINSGVWGWASYSICTDASDHIYISGANGLNKGASFIFGGDTISFPNATYRDVPSFLLKLDSTGNIICYSTLDGGAQQPNSIASDSTGKFIYMGGMFETTLNIGNNDLECTSGGGDPYVGRWQSCECDIAVSVGPQSQTVCEGQSVTLTVSGGTNYTWSPSTGLNATTGSSVIATPTVTTTYIIRSGSGSCTATDTDMVIVTQGPNKPKITLSNNVLTSTATQGNQWYRNGTEINGATNETYNADTVGCYWVIATNPANGCSATSDTICITSAGINQLSVNSNQLSIYPNPTGGEIFINISSSVGEVKDWYLQITDVLGRTVYSRLSLNYNNDIDLSNLAAGVYFIIVINKTDRAVVPVMKQ